MKSFQQFITEAKYHGDSVGRVTSSELDDVKRSKRTDTPLKVGRIGANTKKSPAEKKRVKAVGGGKTAPAKTYKDKSDIGVPNRKRSPAGRQQQPTQDKGVKLSAREQQRKAAKERRAAKSGAKTKTADELLAKKAKKTVDPNYKPVKASGLTTKERKALYKKGERALRDIRLKNLGKKSEKELKHKVTSK